MRDSNQLKSELRQFMGGLQAGSDLHKLAFTFLEMLDTLTYSPDSLSTFKAQQQVAILQNEDSNMRNQIVGLQAQLIETRNEVNKLKKIFAFMVGQQEQKNKDEEGDVNAAG